MRNWLDTLLSECMPISMPTMVNLDNAKYEIDKTGRTSFPVIQYREDIPGRSSINSDINPQEMLNGVHSGKYTVVGTGSRGQPIVDFGHPIGIDAGSGLTTQYGTIHSGKNGAHIVPTNPITIERNR
ncbi:polymorphic toxin type 50 domain-containing protein [Paraherbaspirillum soli]|uniref:Polymorphic toxin type 50 domain-containing protein n=1 Tax=Paraherbaspirillum soli TaxID=631222 RepID=A0ABW0M3T8_9BURK